MHEGWSFPPAVVAELAGLPPWVSELALDCPETSGVFRQLGRAVPTTCQRVRIYGTRVLEVTKAVELCLGVQDVRQGLGLKPLILEVCIGGSNVKQYNRSKQQVQAAFAKYGFGDVVELEV